MPCLDHPFAHWVGLPCRLLLFEIKSIILTSWSSLSWWQHYPNMPNKLQIPLESSFCFGTCDNVPGIHADLHRFHVEAFGPCVLLSCMIMQAHCYSCFSAEFPFSPGSFQGAKPDGLLSVPLDLENTPPPTPLQKIHPYYTWRPVLGCSCGKSLAHVPQYLYIQGEMHGSHEFEPESWCSGNQVVWTCLLPLSFLLHLEPPAECHYTQHLAQSYLRLGNHHWTSWIKGSSIQPFMQKQDP